MTTVSSPWNLGMYLSPLVTSELFRGLKRHITLMVHSAGSAIFHTGFSEWKFTDTEIQKCPSVSSCRGGDKNKARPPSPFFVSRAQVLGELVRLSVGHSTTIKCFFFSLLSITSPPPVRKPWYRRISGWPPHPSSPCSPCSLLPAAAAVDVVHHDVTPGAPLLTVIVK